MLRAPERQEEVDTLQEPADSPAPDRAAQARAFRAQLEERFPEMQPGSGAPTLFLINGCGLTCYGARDRDPETSTYVKTQVLALVLVPLLALRAYRVADASGGGWFFLGRVPLSRLARAWNALVLAGALTAASLAGWESHTSTPAYRAAEALAEARAADARGDLEAAARRYAALASTPRREDGRAGLASLLARCAAEAPLARVADLVLLVSGSGYADERLLDAPLVDALARRALEAQAQDPRAGLALAAALAGVDEAAAAPLREPLLAALVARESDVEAATELAALHEDRGELERAEALLAPLAERLGTSEGARILGQALVRRGDLVGSERLLMPWLEARLGRLHQLEAEFDRAMTAAQEAALEVLRSGGADPAWYARYDSSGPEEKEQQVVAFVQERLRTDASVARAREQFQAVSDVVPVALDLGMVKLQRAQGLEGQARTDELLGAERVFLAVRGVAADSPTYKLGLAQVYYWLGRPDEGAELLEELLTPERSAERLLAVAQTLREVGDATGSLSLVDEAYEQATTDEERHAAAGFRAVLTFDMDERIVWLERSDPAQVDVQASLAQARGVKALERGDEEEATGHFRAAVKKYEEVAESATTLNNAALVLRLLYGAGGQRRDFEASVDKLVRAERLVQGDSIIKSNLVDSLVSRATLRIAGERLDLAALRMLPELPLLDWLYADAEGRRAVSAALQREPDVEAAWERLSALRVLSPKSPSHYALSSSLLALGRDVEAHRALLRAVQAAGLDHGDVAERLEGRLGPAEPAEVDRARHRLASVEALRPAIDEAATPATRALWLDAVLLARLQLHALGAAVDLDAAVALAEEAHATGPSHGTRGALLSALLARAAARAAALPAFADMRRRVGRALEPHTLVAAGLAGGEASVREALAADADVRRAGALVVEQTATLPEENGAWEWAVLKPVAPEAAAQVAATLSTDEVGRLRRALRLMLHPGDPGAVLAAAWERQALGDEDGARAVLADAAARGVPLPFEP